MTQKPKSKVASLRKKAGLTQVQLAVLVGVTPNTIQNWEKDSGLDQLERYLKLAEVFGCKASELIEYVDVPQEEKPKSKGFSLPELRELRERWGTGTIAQTTNNLKNWLVENFFAGATDSHFWVEIKEWANRVLGSILDGINAVVEVTSDAFVYLVKEGTRHIYKRMEVWVKNIDINDIKTEYKEESISRSEIPDEIKAQLQERAKLKLMQLET